MGEGAGHVHSCRTHALLGGVPTRPHQKNLRAPDGGHGAHANGVRPRFLRCAFAHLPACATIPRHLSKPSPRSIIGRAPRLPRISSRSLSVCAMSTSSSPELAPLVSTAPYSSRAAASEILPSSHVARDKLGLALERIAPAAAPGGYDPHHLACEHGLAIDETARDLSACPRHRP